MKTATNHLLSVLAAFLLAGITSYAADKLPDIIPQPQSLELRKGSCRVAGIQINCDDAFGEDVRGIIAAFADRLKTVCGKESTVAYPIGLRKSAEKGNVKGMVIIMNRALGQEEYVMDISAGKILIYASAAPGVLWGIRTLQQMLPPEIYRNAPAKVHLSVPCCLIQDKPRFKYRGVMLDCCRHFFSTDEIKRQLDVMSIYKCNRLHWHLSDDQGWRIEIKSRPLLTIAGAWRAEEDNPKYGGFYTEDEVRDIISYAAARGITVIPEIDLPGHMMSALTCYPELGCTGKGYEITNRWGVYKDVLCAGNEAVYAFLEDVLTEICDIFPSEYIHIGGDECPKDRWRECPKCQAKIRELGLEDTAGATKEQRLQNYVTARIQAFLAGKGRKIIGWDEILEGELSPGATVMSWRGSKGGIKAAAAGFDVIMTPNSHCYFDYAQSPQLDKEPKGITRKPERAITLEKVYSMEPCVNMDAESAKHVLGVQCNLWTEYIAANDHLEYMLLPRMIALSEVQWRPAGNRDFDAFKTSLQHHQFRILDILGVNYRKLD